VLRLLFPLINIYTTCFQNVNTFFEKNKRFQQFFNNDRTAQDNTQQYATVTKQHEILLAL
jgi:hypothetical protein